MEAAVRPPVVALGPTVQPEVALTFYAEAEDAFSDELIETAYAFAAQAAFILERVAAKRDKRSS